MGGGYNFPVAFVSTVDMCERGLYNMEMIMKRTLAKKNGKKGFTLVEVIVVLVILAILAAIAIPALTGYIDKAKRRAVVAEARNVRVAIQAIVSETYGEGAKWATSGQPINWANQESGIYAYPGAPVLTTPNPFNSTPPPRGESLIEAINRLTGLNFTGSANSGDGLIGYVTVTNHKVMEFRIDKGTKWIRYNGTNDTYTFSGY
jgi:prepilin-type N-terminal cleavage/methylation domain-containing protein